MKLLIVLPSQSIKILEVEYSLWAENHECAKIICIKVPERIKEHLEELLSKYDS